MTKEEILQTFSDINYAYNNCSKYDTLKRMLDELTEPCDDAISRAWLKEAIHNFYYGLKHTPTEEDIQAYIDAAPPVTPKQKMGHWVKEKKHHKDDFQEFDYWDVRCSECGARKRIGWTNIRHCPMCGAKMSENPTGSESEDTE